MNKVYGVEILNKGITAKEEYYTKLLNTLHDVYIHLGYTPDPQFYGALLFTKAKDENDFEEVSKLSEFEESRIKQYSEYLCDIISKRMDDGTIDPTDLLSLIVFQKENPATEEYFDNILYKSQCKHCDIESVTKEPRVFKNKLGHFCKEN